MLLHVSRVLLIRRIDQRRSLLLFVLGVGFALKGNLVVGGLGDAHLILKEVSGVFDDDFA